MLRNKVVCVLAAAFVAALAIGQAVSQEAPTTGTRGPRGQRGGNQGGDRAAQFRQQASDRMKEAFGATDEEWKALQPLVEKVQTLSRQVRGGGMMMGRGGRGPRGADQPAEGAAAPQLPDVEKKMADLQKVLQNKESKPEEIKKALADYREARGKARVDLEKAQKELKAVLTLKQEAQAVTMGMLE